MQIVKYILVFITLSTWSQSSIKASFITKTNLNVGHLVQIDNYGSLYQVTNGELNIKKKETILTYANLQLGEINSVNAFNPLKINVFYKDFNSIVILDNRLAEITKVNFNEIQPFRIISHVSTGGDNTVWLFNETTRQLELFDYLTHKTRVTTLPIDGNILALESNYNYSWLLTDQFIYTYNYFGSLLSKNKNPGYTSIKASGNELFFLKENSLFYKANNSGKHLSIELPELLIKQFLVTDETLYIYDGKFLYRYQLITN